MKKENTKETKYCQHCVFHKNKPGTCYYGVPTFMGRKQPTCDNFKAKKGVK